MLKNRKLLIIPIVLIVGVSIVYIMFSFQKQPPPGELLYIPQLNIPNYQNIENKITIDIDNPDIPDSAYVLQNSITPFSLERINSVANNLNYAQEPIISNVGSFGPKYIYNSEEQSTIFTPEISSISFRSLQPLITINKQINDDELIRIAGDFLNNTLEADVSNLDFINFTYYQVSSTGEGFNITTKNNADFYQLNFSPTIGEYGVITLDPSSTPYHVWLLPDGTVHKAITQEIGELNEVGDKQRIKSINEINDNLDQAALISLDQGKVNLTNLNSQLVSSISINKINLAYLYEPSTSEVLQPIFVMSGTASLLEPQDEVEAVLYMPAISNPS